jgi:hypothetical protein
MFIFPVDRKFTLCPLYNTRYERRSERAAGRYHWPSRECNLVTALSLLSESFIDAALMNLRLPALTITQFNRLIWKYRVA